MLKNTAVRFLPFTIHNIDVPIPFDSVVVTSVPEPSTNNGTDNENRETGLSKNEQTVILVPDKESQDNIFGNSYCNRDIRKNCVTRDESAY